MTTARAERAAAAGDALSPALIFVFALTCGTLVANLYFAQGLINVISPALHLDGALAGVIVTAAQLGYTTGLLFLVSLGDLVENRRLILLCVAGTALGLCGAAAAPSAPAFLVASLVFGTAAAGAQVIMPLAAALARPDRRGSVIGSVQAGLITGILLARPFANVVSAAWGWRAVFWISAVLCVLIGVVLWFTLPQRRPSGAGSYRKTLASVWHLARTQPLLRRRSFYQAVQFGVFNIFWTAVPLVLAQHFGFGEHGIALFALAAAGGALAAPFVGQAADKGLSRPVMLVAIVAVIAAFVVAGWSVAAGSVAVLALAALVLDGSAQANQILNQRVVVGIDPAAGGRLNSVYMTIVYLGAACGSVLGGALYFYGGWNGAMLAGGVLGAGLLAYALGEGNRTA